MAAAREHEAQASGMVPPRLCIVVPCYNEEAALPETARALTALLGELIAARRVETTSRLLFVDDGSRDATWALVRAAHDEHARVAGLRLAHNAGQQRALYAGLMWALEGGFDCAISIDADLQDDPAAISQMLDQFAAGAQIVYGVRERRRADTAFKRASAAGFYRIMRWLGVEMVPNAADFRLMGRRSLEALAEYREVNLFLRGIVPQLGFTTAEVRYERAPRRAGSSKYSLGAMLSFAFDGITSFSVRPIRCVTASGAFAILVSLVMVVYTLVRTARGETVPGWSSLMMSIWFIGGLIVLALGIVGEYVGRIYLEAKHRPRYIVADRIE